MTRKLQITVIVLLLLINIASGILLKEMKKALLDIDYTIYVIKPEVSNYEDSIYDENETLLQKIIASFKEDSKERKYKYFKKLKLTNYCQCDECHSKWVWGDPPPYKMLTSGVSVAANPKIFPIGTHLRIGTNYFVVHYNSDEIPSNEIYIYLKNHERNNESLYMGIYDVYKEK